MAKSSYLYIFLHIPKCAGSSIRKHIRKNFKDDEVVHLNLFDWRLTPELKKTHKDYLNRARDYFDRYSSDEKKKIKVIFGHAIPWGVHKIFKRKARYFTFVRNPKNRVISLYNFFRFRFLNENTTGKKSDLYCRQFLINNKIPNFRKWYREKYGKAENITDTMCQFLKNFGYIEEPISRLTIRKALEKFFYVGIFEDFKQDSYYIYKKLGINKLFWKQNVSNKFVDNNIEINASKIRMDDVLYEEALKYKKRIIKKDEKFFSEIFDMTSREVYIPINQLTLDTKQTLIDVSNYLKRKSKFYFRFFNLLRDKG